MTKMSITQSLSNICKTTELISFLYWSCLLSRSFRKKLERNVQIAWQYHQAIWQYHFSHISLQDHFALVRFRRKLRPYPVVLPFSCDNCWSKTPGGIHTTTSVLHLQRYRSTISQDRQLYFEYNQTSLYPPPVIRPTPLYRQDSSVPRSTVYLGLTVQVTPNSNKPKCRVNQWSSIKEVSVKFNIYKRTKIRIYMHTIVYQIRSWTRKYHFRKNLLKYQRFANWRLQHNPVIIHSE